MGTASEFVLVLGILAGLMLLGIIVRATVKPLKKYLVPSCVIGGIIGFILINVGIIKVPASVFEDITFHLFNISFISITLSSTRKEEVEKEGKKSLAMQGGLYLALLFGLLISVQGIAGAIIGYGLNFAGMDFNPINGELITHAFAQGPGQALAIGRSFELYGVVNSARIGLFYAAVGYLCAVLFGIPLAKYMKKKLNKGSNIAGIDDTELLDGILKKDNNISVGRQTVHHANVDTITVHASITVFTYWISYLAVGVIARFVPDPKLVQMLYNFMFVWGILSANIVKAFLRFIKKDYIIDKQIQSSISGLSMDFLMIACFTAITISALGKDLVPALIICALITVITIVVCYVYTMNLKSKHVERCMIIFGIATGTAITGMLLLRIVDPQYETSAAEEAVWWNIFNLLTGFVVFLAPVIPVIGLPAWIGILAVNAAVMLVLMKLVKKKMD